MSSLKSFIGPSPTGFYTYKGKPLDKAELDILRANGVRIPEKPFDWNQETKTSPGYVARDWDIMPDNRLKHPAQRKNHRDHKSAAERLTQKDIAAIWTEYDALPDPKPDEFEWMSKRTARERIRSLLWAGLHSGRSSERVKALSTWMEYERSRPKQTVENINGEVRPATMDELLAAVAALTGKPIEFVKEVFAEKPTQ